MSFDPLMKAIEENPALAEELRNAKTPRERHPILDTQYPEDARGGHHPPGTHPGTHTTGGDIKPSTFATH